MAEETNAAFNEVLEVVVDTEKFKSGLEQLRQLYQEFLDSFGDAASGVVGAGFFSGIKDEFGKLREDVANFSQASIQLAQETFSSVQSALEKIDSKEEETSAKRSARAAKALQEAKEVADAESGGGNVPPGKARDEAIRLQGIADENDLLVDKTLDQSISDLHKQRNQEDRAYAELAKANRAQELADERQINEMWNARLAAEKQAAAQRKQDDDAALQRDLKTRAAAERDAANQEKLRYQRTRSPEENVEAAQLQATKEYEAYKKKILDEEQESDGILGSHLTKLGNMAVRIAEVYVLWRAVNAVIGAIGEVLAAPFKALESGVQYLDDLDKRSDELQGTLLANVKYSDDIATNFQKTASQAKDVVQAFQDISAKTSLPLDKLLQVYQALSSSGGAKAVKSNADLVDVTTLINASLRASGNYGENLRRIVTELPDFFNGAAEKAKNLSEILHVAPADMTQLANEAKKTGDLLGLLKPKLDPYLSALENAEQHHYNINQSLQLFISRLEGAFAKPFFDTVTEVMKNILAYVEQNYDMLMKWAEASGHFVDIILVGLKALTDYKDPIKNTLSGLSNLVVDASELVTKLILAAKAAEALQGAADKWIAPLANNNPGSLISRGLGALMGVDIPKIELSPTDKDNDQGVIRNLQKIDAEFDTATQKAEAARKAIANALSAPSGAESSFDAIKKRLDEVFTALDHPDRTKPVNTLRTSQADFNSEIAAIKERYEAQKNAVEEGVADLVISKRDAANQIAGINEAELKAAIEAAQKYKAMILANRGDGSAQALENQQQKLKQLDTTISSLTRTLEKGTSVAARAGLKEGVDVNQIIRDSAAQVEKLQIAGALATEQSREAQGYETHLDFLHKKQDADAAAHEIEVNRLSDLLNRDTADTTERQRLLGQLAAENTKYKNTVAANDQAIQADNLRTFESFQKFATALQELQLEAEELSNVLLRLTNVDKTSIDTRSFDIKAKELEINKQLISSELDLAQKRGGDIEKIQQLTLELQRLTNAQAENLNAELQAIQGSNNPQGAKIAQMRSVLSNRLGQQQSDLAQNVASSGVTLKSFAEFNQLSEAIANTKQALDNLNPSLTQGFQTMLNKLAGFDIGAVFKSINDDKSLTEHQKTQEKATVSLEAFANGLQRASSIVSDVSQGYKKGGILGGAGAALSDASGLVGAFNPLAGAVVGAVGSIFSTIGSLFSAAAQRIADDIKKGFSATMEAFSTGQSTLIQTLNTVEQEKNDAISRLSGKKGGQDQLDQLLPTLNNEIDQLKKQQKDLMESFTNSLNDLRLQSDTLAGINDQWVQINKQVSDYIGAGGDAAQAAQFLSLSLEKVKQSAQDELNQGYSTAIQDAISLNGLLQQRADIVQNAMQQEFSLINKDSIERRQTGAQSTAEQLKAIKDQEAAQLKDIDYQIQTATIKVNAESQVFQISQNIDELHRQDDALTLAALDEQLQKYQDLQKIIQAIQVGANGQYSLASGVLPSNQYVTQTYTINVTVDAGNASNPAQIGQSIADEIQRQMRQGLR